MSLAAVEVVPYAAGHAAAFRELNLEWLRRYFQVEPIDEAVLSHPERIIAEGGAIFCACADGCAVGTVALLHAGGGRYELTKMAVAPAWRRQGISRRLLEAAIAAFRGRRGSCLFLESSSILTPALTLYESAGFVHAPRPDGPAHYSRADVYMVYRG